jgi:NADH-quinone oxidoreductase subunit J
MNAIFYLAGAVAVLSTGLAISRSNAVHALLYVIVSLLAVALAFFTLGAPFAAVLEVIVYAGAIMVLFVFVVMLLNLGPEAVLQEGLWLPPSNWAGPALLAGILMAELAYVILREARPIPPAGIVSPQALSVTLLGPYLLGVELASFVLMAGLVAAFHAGTRDLD